MSDQRAGRCPFLTEALKASTQCVKATNSRGVCTISAVSNGPRQDWLVCPYRALDDGLLADIVRRLYRMPALEPSLIRPVVALDDQAGKAEILSAVYGSQRVFIYFQDKLGGEIGLSKTAASPELSFAERIPEADQEKQILLRRLRHKVARMALCNRQRLGSAQTADRAAT